MMLKELIDMLNELYEDHGDMPVTGEGWDAKEHEVSMSWQIDGRGLPVKVIFEINLEEE